MNFLKTISCLKPRHLIVQVLLQDLGVLVQNSFCKISDCIFGEITLKLSKFNKQIYLWLFSFFWIQICPFYRCFMKFLIPSIFIPENSLLNFSIPSCEIVLLISLLKFYTALVRLGLKISSFKFLLPFVRSCPQILLMESLIPHMES